nr:retrotransposon protein, putative, Ty1-copia subclass [Tanacetum cinerariifolium]
DNENNVINNIPILLNVDDAPKTYKEAITSRNSAFWKEATDDEIDSLVSNNTWDLSDLPPGSEAIGCRWVYGIKYHTDRFIQNFKARLTKDYGVILCLHVDDILIVGTNMKCINETKKFLSSCSQMKDMNDIDTILGIKVKIHSGGYALNQCHYIDKFKDKFQHLNIKEANTSYESSCKLVENNGRDIAQIEYASAICCLICQQMLPGPTAVMVEVRIAALHTMYPAVAWVALLTEAKANESPIWAAGQRAG